MIAAYYTTGTTDAALLVFTVVAVAWVAWRSRHEAER